MKLAEIDDLTLLTKTVSRERVTCRVIKLEKSATNSTIWQIH